MVKRNIEETIKEVRGKMPASYDLTVLDIEELAETARGDLVDAIIKAFDFGYVLGHRATVAGKYTERRD